MKDKSALALDPYFNTSDYEDPFWLAKIKLIIGWQKTEQEKNAIIEKNIIKNFRKNVKFEETKGGALSISVTHVNQIRPQNMLIHLWKKLGDLLKTKALQRKNLG